MRIEFQNNFKVFYIMNCEYNVELIMNYDDLSIEPILFQILNL